MKLRQFQNLSGLTLISEATKSRFEEQWPNVTIPRTVISNGLDFSLWHPATEKENLIVVVGRTCIIRRVSSNSALGSRHLPCDLARMARQLHLVPEIDGAPHYFNEVRKILTPLSDQCDIEIDIPFKRVPADHGARGDLGRSLQVGRALRSDRT